MEDGTADTHTIELIERSSLMQQRNQIPWLHCSTSTVNPQWNPQWNPQ